WLIVSDARAVLPWELVCGPGDDFFARRFILGHWVGRRGLPLVAEAPLGLIELAHYHQRARQVRRWQAALGGEDLVTVGEDTGLLALPPPHSGHYGLHILRFADPCGHDRITCADSPRPTGPEGEALIADRHLDLDLKRPVVGLSFVQDGPETETPAS